MVLAGGALLLAGAAVLARSRRPEPKPAPSHGQPRLKAGPVAGIGFANVLEDPPTESLDSLVGTFVPRWKASGFRPEGLETSLSELLRSFALADVLAELARQGPLEEGFSVLRRLVAERRALKESVLQVVVADRDPETRLFALRLLPPFSLLDSLEKVAVLRSAERSPEGELGRQLVRYVSKDPAEDGVSAWLTQLLEGRGDPEVKAEALRALVRFPDPLAAAALKRCFESPDAPVSQRASILAALSASPDAVARSPWLPDCPAHPG